MSDVIYNISSGFFDSVNGDRLYSAADMIKPYKRVIADGIFPTPQGTPSTDFQVVAVSGMSVAVLAGNAMIGSRWAENTDDVGITIAGNSSSSPRIDSIFLHIDTGMDTRAAGVVYRQGTAAGTPTAPAMVQTDNITELRLADILVAPSAAIITQANITDQRGGSDCPWVAGLIQQVDTSALFEQYRAAYAEQQQEQTEEWKTFMDHLARDYDISMSLRKHESTYTSTAAASLIPINIDGYDTTKDLLQVFINGIFAVEGTHYIVKSAAQIQLTNAISAGQKVHFVIYKAVMGGAQPIIPTDEQVQDAVDAYMDAHPGALVVDPELSDTSTHAIQNKAVTEAIENVNGRLGEVETDLNQYVWDRYDFVYPTNWYNPAEVESGRVYKNGTVETSSTMSHTGYIPVEEGDKVQMYRTNAIAAVYRRNVCCYDANKVVVPNTGSDNWNDAAYTIPSGVKYVIYTFDNTLISQTFNLMIVRDGIKPTKYTPYFVPYADIADDFITSETEGIINKVRNNELSTTNLVNRYGCALPPTTLRQTVGLPEVWYFDNMGTPKGCEYGVTNSGNPLKRLNKGVQFGNTTAFTSSSGFYYNMFDILLNVIRSSQSYPRRIVTENLSNCTVLAIGDSTIDSDYLTGRMLSYFSDKGKTLTLLGTLGDGSETNKNEGRSGWKASDYFTDRKYDGVTNPFYNPTTQTFDFEYYMTNQGYTTPDFVVLQLGINDMYSYYSTAGIIESTYGYIKGMIDSILAYNDNIKVLINLPTPPNSDKSRHSNTEFLYWNTIIRYNDYALAQIKATYDESKVRCTYCHLILDPDTDIADTVHPTQDGYGKMALEVINQINCWQAGV